METIAQMKERARAQDAYGKWNTAPLWNEIARREAEQRGPVARFAYTCGHVALIAAGFALWLGPIALFVHKLFVGY